MLTRILLLLSITWVIQLTTPLFSVMGKAIAGRDLILIGGGLFLLWKSVHEIHESMTPGEDEDGDGVSGKARVSFAGIIAQIAIIAIMIIAVVVSVAVMMFAAKPIGEFVDENPTIKILALSFLTVVGILLIAEGFGQHVPKGYVYFGMAFSLAVELLNIRMRPNQQKLRLHKRMPGGGD